MNVNANASTKPFGSTQANTRRAVRTNELRPANDLMCYLRRYAGQKPDVAALWCLGIGIIVGWKIKPW
ncbi:MAG: hypothetical protein KDA91_00960 [Planctomycetaceae bacterium]|nr:hypothetical protein [Planctomycetaceae bacterium]